MAGVKMQRELKMLKNNCDKFKFSFTECQLFHNRFFSVNMKMQLKNVIRM